MENLIRGILISLPIIIALVAIGVISFGKLKTNKRPAVFLLIGSGLGGICIILRILFSPFINLAVEHDWVMGNVSWISGIYFFVVNILMAACLLLFAIGALKTSTSKTPPKIIKP